MEGGREELEILQQPQGSVLTEEAGLCCTRAHNFLGVGKKGSALAALGRVGSPIPSVLGVSPAE